MIMEFQCKTFSLNHSLCSMKVGSDSILLSCLSPEDINPKKILDIGCGSGIISLCMAQNYSTSSIIGIDIDKMSIYQAKDNFEKSRYSERLSAILIDFNEFADNRNEEFDLIITNPPYFVNSLLPEKEQKLRARHTLSLSFEDLCKGVSKLLSQKGIFALIIPYTNHKYFIQIAQKEGLFSRAQYNIIPREGKEPNRVIFHFSKQENPDFIIKEIALRDKENNPNKEYITLTKKYLL